MNLFERFDNFLKDLASRRSKPRDQLDAIERAEADRHKRGEALLAVAASDETAGADFFADPSPEKLEGFMNAERKRAGLALLRQSAEAQGSSEQRLVDSPAVEACMVALAEEGIATRKQAIELAREPLAERAAELLRKGADHGTLSGDKQYREWHAYADLLNRQCADAAWVLSYFKMRKQGACSPQPYGTLKGVVLRPLPTPPYNS